MHDQREMYCRIMFIEGRENRWKKQECQGKYSMLFNRSLRWWVLCPSSFRGCVFTFLEAYITFRCEVIWQVNVDARRVTCPRKHEWIRWNTGGENPLVPKVLVGGGEGNENGMAIYGSNRLIDEACFIVMRILPRTSAVPTRHSPGSFWLSDPKVW